MHGELTTLSSCICPGYEAVFECVVTGGGATIWSGTAFDNCSSDRIILRHSQFIQPGYNINNTCGDGGQVISRAVSAVNDSYTSQLVYNNIDITQTHRTTTITLVHVPTVNNNEAIMCKSLVLLPPISTAMGYYYCITINMPVMKYIQCFRKLWDGLGTRLMPWSAVLLARLQKLVATTEAIPCYNIAKIISIKQLKACCNLAIGLQLFKAVKQ